MTFHSAGLFSPTAAHLIKSRNIKKLMIMINRLTCPLAHILVADRPHPNADPATKNRQNLIIFDQPPKIRAALLTL